MDDFADKYGPYAVVTGASSGIGANFARQLAALKMNIVLVARREDLMKKLAVELEKTHSVQTKIVLADLTSDGGCEKVLTETAEVDVGLLVNNAGMEFNGHFLQSDESKHMDLVALNVTAVTKMAHAFGRRLVKRNHTGGIIFVSSIARNPFPWAASYSASKAFVSNLAYIMKFELQGSGIDITALEPGLVLTDMAVRGDFERLGWPATTPEDCVKSALDGFCKGLLRITPNSEGDSAADEKIMTELEGASNQMKQQWDSKLFQPLPSSD